MRPLVEVMAALRAAEIRVWPDGEQLRYQAPKGALTPALLAELRSRKDDILDLCRQVRSGPPAPAPRHAEPELSLAQQRLWLLDRMEGPGPAYNIALALHLRGALDEEALRQSCASLVQRHEALRTAFQLRGDTVRPVVAAICKLPWTMVDLQHLPEELRLPEARRQARDEALRPFDLGQAPLIRFVLWTLGAREQVLMMTLHHIVADGRSIEILAEELAIAYHSRRLGREPQLPELALQYSDFAWEQRRALSDRLLQAQLDHWRERLAGLPPLLEVPTDRARPAVFSSAGATIASRLSRDDADRLKRLAQPSGATLYMALVAAFATLLARYTGRDDIAIACPATHRNRPELDRLVGFFINTLPLRVDLSGGPTFRDLLARVRGVVGDAFRNQDVPFDKMVEALRVERDPSHAPLVQVSMVLRDAASACPKLPELETAPFEFDIPITRFDIALEMYESAAGIDIFWIYSSHLYDPATIERMARHLIHLIGHALADPDRDVFGLDLLDATERDRLLLARNDTDRPYVLDTRGGLTPIGVEGDLFIGGDGSERVSPDDAGATAEGWIADPFDPRPGRRLYRTGKRARFRADGTLEVLGRRDRPVPRRPAEAAPYEPPANDAEARLAAIWAGVLGCERIGRHDVFFDLGGHSLLATQIVARVEDAFGVALPIRVLFEDGTVASMARALTDGAAAEAAALRARIDRMEPDEIRALLQRGRGLVSGAASREAGGNRFDGADSSVS